jgi:hypothetical protein
LNQRRLVGVEILEWEVIIKKVIRLLGKTTSENLE